MAILVTGGTGFTGSNIVKELVEQGNKVISLDIVPPDDLLTRYLAPWANNVIWMTGDTVDRATTEAVSAYYEIDKIVHVATYSTYGNLETDNGRRVCDVNLQGTLNALDIARRLKVKRFIFISSAAVYYGRPTSDQPLREDAPLSPRGLSPERTWVLLHYQARWRTPHPAVRTSLRLRYGQCTNVAELGAHREGDPVSLPRVLAQPVGGQSGSRRAN